MFKKVSEHLCLEKETMTIQQHASFDSSAAELNATSKLVKAWESKNAKNAAKAGGISMMALSLAACGGSSDTVATTPVVETPVVETPVVETPVVETPVVVAPTVNTITKALLDFASGDTLAGTDGDDVLNIEINSALGATTTISAIETISVTGYGALSVDFTAITDVTKFVTTGSTGQMTLNNITDASMAVGFAGTGTNDIVANYKAGTLTGNDDTLNIDLSGATAVALDADAGFENISLTTGGAASSGAQAATAASSLTTLTVPGVTTIDMAGAGTLTLNSTFAGMTSVDASTMTGAVVGSTINATSGLSTEGFTGATAGTTLKLGSGADNIKFTDSTSAATGSNTIKLGAGDDTADIVTGGSGATYVFGEDGDDTVQINGIASTDLVDLGAGDDTLIADGTNASAILRGVENVTVNAGATLSVGSADTALAVTAKASGGAVDVTGLSAGSSVTVTKAASATQATNVTVGYDASEAAATVEVGGGMSGTLTLSKIADATVNLSAASDISGHYSLTGATSFTLNATGALSASAGKNVTDAAATDTLATVDINGTKAVDVGTITSTAMTTVAVDAASGALTYGAIGGDSTKMSSVELTSAAGAIAGDAAIGLNTNASALSVTASAKDAIDLGAIISTKVGNVSITNTNPLAKALDVGAIGSDATEIGTVTMSGSGDVTIGLIGNATPTAASVGAINLTSTLGKVDGGAVLIDAAAATGIEVNLTAKTTIDSDGSGTAMAIENTGGNITGSLAGTAAAVVDYLAQTSGVVNLTATNTGGLTSTITNAGTTGDGGTSTINLGNAASGNTNSVTIAGTIDNLVINGGTGNDTVAFAATNDTASGTIALGTGTNTVDFTEVDTVSSLTDTSTDNGIAINLSASTVTFNTGTAYVSTIASGKATGYDANGDEDHATQTSTQIVGDDFMYSLSGVTSVVGSDKADYIAANSTGTTITGGAGADTIVLGAGADTVIFNSSATTDTVSGFTTNSDKLNVDGVLATGDVTLVSSAFTAFDGTATATDNAIVLNTGTAALSTATNNAAVVALFEHTGGTDAAKMLFAAGEQVIFVHQDDDATSGTDFDAQVFLVDNAAGTITATLVATIGETGDSEILVVGDFV
ncbi:hypothetical protein OAA66_00850 [Planktomarina temperata]|nr:hypothetical protein [Planktomarina temperata]